MDKEKFVGYKEITKQPGRRPAKHIQPCDERTLNNRGGMKATAVIRGAAVQQRDEIRSEATEGKAA